MWGALQESWRAWIS